MSRPLIISWTPWKLEFYPKVMRNLGFIRSKLDFDFVMVTNQDGLGTASFPEETFWPAHNLMMKTLEGEGITFDDICIDRSMPDDNAPTRKPRTGMLAKYLDNPDYDLSHSFVIGDRPTDVELAKNLGCRAILLQDDTASLKPVSEGGGAACDGLEDYCALAAGIGIRLPNSSLPVSVRRKYVVLPRRQIYTYP